MFALFPTFYSSVMLYRLRRYRTPLILIAAVAVLFSARSFALDLEALAITGVLASAMEALSGLTDGVKAFVLVIAFFVALIALSALRNFSPVLFFIGVAIFAASGLAIAGAIAGATTSLVFG